MWAELGSRKRGLAVEGKRDKKAVEAFLDAGERAGSWANWRAKVIVAERGDSNKVLAELGSNGDSRVWGLIDRDWRTDAEVVQLQNEHPRLLILPRTMIENYCIAPDELEAMLPPSKRFEGLQTTITKHLDNWVQNGALWRTFHERGGFQFCRGHEAGYPMALLHTPVPQDNRIDEQVRAWHRQLEPNDLLAHYRRTVEAFRADDANHFTWHLHGKNFFNQVVVRMLNTHFSRQSDADYWFNSLFESDMMLCPTDLVDLFGVLLAN